MNTALSASMGANKQPTPTEDDDVAQAIARSLQDMQPRQSTRRGIFNKDECSLS